MVDLFSFALAGFFVVDPSTLPNRMLRMMSEMLQLMSG